MILEHAGPFLADCYDNTSSRPNATRASDDLYVGTRLFSQKIIDTMGLTGITTPPSTHLHRQHPLHEDLRKALNKHRTLRTPESQLIKLTKGEDFSSSVKKILSHKDRALLPKVPDFMTVTAAEGADELITFSTREPPLPSHI